MTDVMEHLEQFDSVLADAICAVVGISDIQAFLRIEIHYERGNHVWKSI